MKKTIICISLIFTILTVLSCKDDKKNGTEVSVPQEVIQKNEIDKSLSFIKESLDSNLDRASFKALILPETEKLVALDSKYEMLNKIAKKLCKEANSEAYKLGYKNFTNEFLKMNNN